MTGKYLTESLKKLVNADPRRRENLLEALEAYGAEYLENKKEHPLDEVVGTYLLKLDELKAESSDFYDKNKLKVSCTKGCSHCCKILVNITEDEGKLIKKYVEDRGIKPAWGRAFAQLTAEEISDWGKLPHSKRACMFLDSKGTCKIYEVRPGPCRLMEVVSNPNRCNSIKYPSGRTKNVASFDAELLYSAIINMSKTDTIPRIMTRLFKPKGEI